MTLREAGALLAVLALAAVLAFGQLALHGLWLDETWSVYMATVDEGMFKYRLKTREANMSLYYLFLRGWVPILGTSETAMRVPSAIFATGAVAAAYALGRRLLGPVTGLAAAFVLSLNAFHLHHAHDARSYSLTELLVTLAALALVALLGRPSWIRVALYAGTAGASLYAHFFAALALAGQALSVPLLGPRPLPWRHLAAAFGGVLLIGSPLAAFVLLRDVGQLQWVGPVTAGSAWERTLELAGGETPALVYAALAALALGFAAWEARRRGRGAAPAAVAGARWWPYAFALLWLVLPPLVAYAVSQVKPIYVERYLIVVLPPLALLVGAGLARLRRPWLFALALLLVAAVSLRPGGRWHERGVREDWRGATGHVLAEARRGDALLFYAASVRHAFDYYRGRLGRTEGAPEVVFPRWEAYRDVPTETFLESLPERHPRVWLVLSHHLGERREPGLRAIVDALERDYRPVRRTTFENVEVRLYERDG